jgi:1-acyl-sn-glycerol-3-phosphate acyltransferase
VRRHAAEGVVAEAAAAILAEPRFILALAPEGTRSRVDHWRTGFYRIAEAAAVPIVPVWFDWSTRRIGIGAPLVPSGDLERDVTALQAVYRPAMARHPELFWP